VKARFTVDTPLTPFGKLLHRTAFVTLLGVWIFAAWMYSRLPATIPIHFDLKGRPDDFEQKEMILLIPGVATLLWLLLRFVKPVRRWPLATIKDQDAIYLFSMLSILINLLLFFILFLSYRTILGKTKGLGQWFLPISLAVFVFPTLYFLVRTVRERLS
jgi:uncharacterized membrane protein